MKLLLVLSLVFDVHRHRFIIYPILSPWTEAASEPSPFFADISSAPTNQDELPSSSTNPFLHDLNGDRGSDEYAGHNDADMNDANDADDDASSSETEGCDSVSSRFSSIVMIGEDDVASVSAVNNTTTTTMDADQNVLGGATPSALTDDVRVKGVGGGREKRVILVSTADSEPPSSIEDRPRQSTDSNATWYCDPFLGHPDESTWKDVTFLDSCESAHESVEASQEEEKLRRSGGESQRGEAASKSGMTTIAGDVGTAVDSTGFRVIGEESRNAAGSALLADSRKSTAISLNEFDKNVMQNLETNSLRDDAGVKDARSASRLPALVTGSAAITPAPQLAVEAIPTPVKQRRSSSISNADIPPTSFGSLSVDFVQVRCLYLHCAMCTVK